MNGRKILTATLTLLAAVCLLLWGRSQWRLAVCERLATAAAREVDRIGPVATNFKEFERLECPQKLLDRALDG